MRRILRSVGLLIGLLGVAFVTRELVRSWDDVREAVTGADPVLLAAALLVGCAGPLAIGLGWRRCLSLLGARHPVRDTLHWYYVGQLGKYVPGGIWTVVGRGEMARRAGVPGGIGYSSTILSLAVTYLAAVLTMALALAAGAAGGDGVAWQPVLILLPLGLLALHPRVVHAALRAGRRLLRRELQIPVPRWRDSIWLLVMLVPAWLAIGGATWLVAAALDPGTPSVRNVMFATALAWIAGFIVVPAPGGIGVREAVFVAAAISLSSAGIAAAVAVVARVMFILIDLAGAGASTALARSRTKAGPSG
jgi:glycosyltransferase 2 family protein